MKIEKKQVHSFVFSIVILCIAFLINMILEIHLQADSLIPAVFTLAIFLISLFTEGMYYGIAASLLSVLALNFAFRYPYYKFNFSIAENIISAIIMLVITILSCILSSKLKQQENCIVNIQSS